MDDEIQAKVDALLTFLHHQLPEPEFNIQSNPQGLILRANVPSVTRFEIFRQGEAKRDCRILEIDKFAIEYKVTQIEGFIEWRKIIQTIRVTPRLLLIIRGGGSHLHMDVTRQPPV